MKYNKQIIKPWFGYYKADFKHHVCMFKLKAKKN